MGEPAVTHQLYSSAKEGWYTPMGCLLLAVAAVAGGCDSVPPDVHLVPQSAAITGCGCCQRPLFGG